MDGRHCVAVSSRTTALWLSLLALGIGPGDEVIVPSFTFAATAGTVALAGAVPVFADIDPVTFCLDPAAVAAAAITPRTAAVVPVHLYGHPAPMGILIPLAARRRGAALAPAVGWRQGLPVAFRHRSNAESGDFSEARSNSRYSSTISMIVD